MKLFISGSVAPMINPYCNAATNSRQSGSHLGVLTDIIFSKHGYTRTSFLLAVGIDVQTQYCFGARKLDIHSLVDAQLSREWHNSRIVNDDNSFSWKEKVVDRNQQVSAEIVRSALNILHYSLLIKDDGVLFEILGNPCCMSLLQGKKPGCNLPHGCCSETVCTATVSHGMVAESALFSAICGRSERRLSKLGPDLRAKCCWYRLSRRTLS